MTNEGLGAEQAEAIDERGVVAYIGRASFRMEQTPIPGNDNLGAAIVQAVSREDTMPIRIPAPPPESEPVAAWAPEAAEMVEITEMPAPSANRRVLSSVAEALVARLEIPRWILATMTALVFAAGVLVAASVVGGTKPVAAPLPALAPAAPLAPALAPVAAAARPDTAAVQPAPVVSTRRSTKTPPAAAPHRAPKKTAAPPPSSETRSGESAIAAPAQAPWVDPFAQ